MYEIEDLLTIQDLCVVCVIIMYREGRKRSS